MNLETKPSQITGIIGGQIVSLSDTPLLTSASTPWSGFLLEEVRGDLVRNEVSWGWHRTHVCLVTRGCIRFTLKVGGRQEHVIVRQGDINVFPNGFGESRFIYDGSNFQAICVEVDPEQINILNQSLPYTALKPQIAVPNAEIAAVLTNMKTEVARGCPSGDLYAQALSLALVAYLESHFAVSPRQSKIPGRFSPSEVRFLTDYIRANLDRGLSLGQLANLVGISSSNLSRIFGRTFGVSPHQFVLALRMKHATALLMSGKAIAEVAQALGFTPSYFAFAFRKAFGTSPSQFRSEHCIQHAALDSRVNWFEEETGQFDE